MELSIIASLASDGATAVPPHLHVYRGFPASSRTSGSRPRRAHMATVDEVTRNMYATCLRVIRSSSTRLPVTAISAITFTWFLDGLATSGPGQITGHCVAALRGEASGN